MVRGLCKNIAAGFGIAALAVSAYFLGFAGGVIAVQDLSPKEKKVEQKVDKENVSAKKRIAQILDSERIPYRLDVSDSQFGPVDALVKTRNGSIGIEYSSEQEIKNSEYVQRVRRNVELYRGIGKNSGYVSLPRPLTMQTGKGKLDLIEYWLYDKGMIRMIKERL
ncbi:hypothetical protein HZA33_00780 [Candidatus Pacearchaeota archaeon]|nr:hypothetical protein [Candidatus Pacearchaeota archaeon]